MARVMIQLGAGKYARATVGVGHIEIAVGDVEGANFFAITSKRFQSDGIWDGCGWDLGRLHSLAHQLAPVAHACEAPALTEVKADLVAQYRRRVAAAAIQSAPSEELLRDLEIMHRTLARFGTRVPRSEIARGQRSRRRQRRGALRMPE